LGSKDVTISIDFRSGIPIYLQIMDQIRQKVASGELIRGDQLPTVRQLAADLRVNWNTVARAYRLLDEAGLISTQQGRGTYIWEQPTEETSQKLREQALEGLTRRYLAECARLGSQPGEINLVFEQMLAAWEAGAPPPEPPVLNE
jgi:GntR family transcriptional regulator